MASSSQAVFHCLVWPVAVGQLPSYWFAPHLADEAVYLFPIGSASIIGCQIYLCLSPSATVEKGFFLCPIGEKENVK
jgi:hypothetical protein